ncbi:DUF6153 family protein [Streptomyces sp. NPDC054887]
MSRQAWWTVRPLGVRLYALLVPALLAGLIAMHGLGPAVPPERAFAAADIRHAAPSHPGPAAGDSAAHGAHAAPAAHGAGTSHAPHGRAPSPVGHDHARDCLHGEGGAGGHVEHADSTCAAGGTSGAPVLPAPAPAGAPSGAPADGTAVAPAAPPGERAPPSLSELQLLRI